MLSASPITGCDAIVRSGISFHWESFKITPVEARSRLVELRDLPVQLSDGSISAFLKPFGVLHSLKAFSHPFLYSGLRRKRGSWRKAFIEEMVSGFLSARGGEQGWVVLLSACRGVASRADKGWAVKRALRSLFNV